MARRKSSVNKSAANKGSQEEDRLYEQLLKDIEKKYGTGTVIRLGDMAARYPHLPTGILSLDEATGIGGLPKGRIVEIYGPESAGKTMISLQCIAETQRRGGRCAFIDVEQAMNASFAKTIGVDIENLTFSQPQSGEQALDIMISLIESGLFSLIVVDSVAALVPQAEIDGEIGDLQVGAQARMMSKVMRKASPVMNQMGTTVIFINQLREKIGVLYGNPEVTPGGKALKFYASLRLDVRKRDSIKNGPDIIGNVVTVKVTKNKVAAPFREARFELMFDSGVSREGQVLDKAVELGFVKKTGAWYSWNGEKIGQGTESARDWLRQNPEIAEELEEQILRELGIDEQADSPEDPVPEFEENESLV